MEAFSDLRSTKLNWQLYVSIHGAFSHSLCQASFLL